MNAQALAASLRGATPEQVRAALKGFSERDCQRLLWSWSFWARAEQLPPPGDWAVWLILSGRGWGKTRTGAETVLGWLQEHPGTRVALVGATAADVRDVMLDGESGLLNVAPPWFRLHYEPSKRLVTAPNGSRALCFSAEEPSRLRGPQFHKAWGDELSSWAEGGGNKDDPWKMLRMCVRLPGRSGDQPRIVVTTTPKPTDTIIRLATKTKRVHITEGHTFDNRANLARAFIEEMQGNFVGTRLGEQELAGKLLLDMPGALFQGSLFYETSVPRAPELQKTVIAVDPAPTSNEGSDYTGIMALGLGYDDHVYVLEDLTVQGSPDQWARAAIKAYHRHQANYIVGEINMGGEMVETTLRTVDDNVAFRPVRAMKGKAKRAEPVAAKLEQRKIHIVGNPSGDHWAQFLSQAKRFTGINGKRDDRVDAFCWGVHELLFSGGFVGAA